jgi:hypothetical protein
VAAHSHFSVLSGSVRMRDIGAVISVGA